MVLQNVQNVSVKPNLILISYRFLCLQLTNTRKELKEIEKFRGIKAVEYLKNEMILQHKLKKTND